MNTISQITINNNHYNVYDIVTKNRYSNAYHLLEIYSNSILDKSVPSSTDEFYTEIFTLGPSSSGWWDSNSQQYTYPWWKFFYLGNVYAQWQGNNNGIRSIILGPASYYTNWDGNLRYQGRGDVTDSKAVNGAATIQQLSTISFNPSAKTGAPSQLHFTARQTSGSTLNLSAKAWALQFIKGDEFFNN